MLSASKDQEMELEAPCAIYEGDENPVSFHYRIAELISQVTGSSES
ncbi:hypothetical protein K5549_006418 [Capra hircus]|uniref:Uncharacterized protein n=1 Tax=Capra hircus TaxID=9925 RepID=A0A452DWN1_CAPHI|nr:hypothetical protein K5549_006418 [Capra hircus]